jgi:hypothetical protein
MLIDSRKADEMQAAVDIVFERLPASLRTSNIKNEIARSVAWTDRNYLQAARRCVFEICARGKPTKLSRR